MNSDSFEAKKYTASAMSDGMAILCKGVFAAIEVFVF